jgi:hypothetical protein
MPLSKARDTRSIFDVCCVGRCTGLCDLHVSLRRGTGTGQVPGGMAVTTWQFLLGMPQRLRESVYGGRSSSDSDRADHAVLDWASDGPTWARSQTG